MQGALTACAAGGSRAWAYVAASQHCVASKSLILLGLLDTGLCMAAPGGCAPVRACAASHIQLTCLFPCDLQHPWVTDKGRQRLLVLGQLTAPPKQVEVTAKEAQGAIGSSSQVGIIRCAARGPGRRCLAPDAAAGAAAGAWEAWHRCSTCWPTPCRCLQGPQWAALSTTCIQY